MITTLNKEEYYYQELDGDCKILIPIISYEDANVTHQDFFYDLASIFDTMQSRAIKALKDKPETFLKLMAMKQEKKQMTEADFAKLLPDVIGDFSILIDTTTETNVKKYLFKNRDREPVKVVSKTAIIIKDGKKYHLNSQDKQEELGYSRKVFDSAVARYFFFLVRLHILTEEKIPIIQDVRELDEQGCFVCCSLMDLMKSNTESTQASTPEENQATMQSESLVER